LLISLSILVVVVIPLVKPSPFPPCQLYALIVFYNRLFKPFFPPFILLAFFQEGNPQAL